LKKLCLLAISYNEENHIKFWIDNHKKFVDEIILIDTGSTDRTIEIAKENGVKVFNYLWEHDFARAKNFALRCASVACNPDWIFFLSPDYWISNSSMEIIREAIQTDDFDAYRTKLMYHYSDWFGFDNTAIHGQGVLGMGQIVLFKNDSYTFYTGRVHETVDSSLLIAEKRIGYLNITRHHDSTNIKATQGIYYDSLKKAEDMEYALFLILNSMRKTLS